MYKCSLLLLLLLLFDMEVSCDRPFLPGTSLEPAVIIIIIIIIIVIIIISYHHHDHHISREADQV